MFKVGDKVRYTKDKDKLQKIKDLGCSPMKSIDQYVGTIRTLISHVFPPMVVVEYGKTDDTNNPTLMHLYECELEKAVEHKSHFPGWW